jgi:lipoprotein-anchoring transpeptidase ErfK/SrfK
MVRLAGTILFSAAASLMLGGTVASAPEALPTAPESAPQPAPGPSPIAAEPPAEPEPPPPPTVEEVMRSGVLIVISKQAQQMFVFKDGEPWGSTRVSTGRRGHATPSGVFPILQKKVRHRSNLYGASMPYMQRLTWDGIALHAGHVPGYPASHGCIRMPGKFARDLYGLTRFDSTAVLIANERLGSHREAHRLASGAPLLERDEPRLGGKSEGETDAWAASGPLETIQLAASASPEAARAYWRQLRYRLPRLGAAEEAIIPAQVNGLQVYRLRASAPGAHALCSALKAEGVACLKV